LFVCLFVLLFWGGLCFSRCVDEVRAKQRTKASQTKIKKASGETKRKPKQSVLCGLEHTTKNMKIKQTRASPTRTTKQEHTTSPKDMPRRGKSAKQSKAKQSKAKRHRKVLRDNNRTTTTLLGMI